MKRPYYKIIHLSKKDYDFLYRCKGDDFDDKISNVIDFARRTEMSVFFTNQEAIFWNIKKQNRFIRFVYRLKSKLFKNDSN